MRPDAQKSTTSGVGVTATFHTVPRATTSPVFRLLDQLSAAGVDVVGAVDVAGGVDVAVAWRRGAGVGGVDAVGAFAVVSVAGAGEGAGVASLTVTRATIPVPGSVVSHFCAPSLR